MQHLSLLSRRLTPLAAGFLLTAVGSAQTLDDFVRPATEDILTLAGIESATIQSLALPTDPGEPFSFALSIEGEVREVSLEPYSVRAAGYEVQVETATGTVVMPPSVESSYRGTIAGYPESTVALNLFEGQIQGVLRLAPGTSWYGLQPVNELQPTAAWDDHIFYIESDVIPMDAQCGGALDVLRGHHEPSDPGTSGAAEGSNTKICQIACDADFEFFQSNGSSVANTENDITTVINGVEAIYESDVDILYDITVIHVEADSNDPYSSTGASSLLSQFQNHWNSQHQADVRDVAHLFTGKNISGSTIGIAYLNVICNKNSAYGLSQSKFSFSMTSRIGLTAHELGHNWNAGHCDGSSTCWIMCSGLGGCAGSVTKFGTNSINSITNKKNSVGCLTTPPPPVAPLLTGVSPATADAFLGGEITVTGFFLEEATSVTIGSTTLTAPFGFTVVSDNIITFQAPSPDSLGATQVNVANDTGSSNSVFLTYEETQPTKLTATTLAFTGLPFNWNFGGEAGDLWFLFASVNDDTTFTFEGYPVLLNSLFLTSGTLDAVGLGTATTTTPGGAVGALVYSQLVVLDGVTFAFQEATGLAGSSIVF